LSSNNNLIARELLIQNRLGLHARAAARLVELARRFHSEMAVEKDGQSVDAKSVVALLSLECPIGTKVVVKAWGDDADQAVAAVAVLIENRFGEE